MGIFKIDQPSLSGFFRSKLFLEISAENKYKKLK